MADIKIAIMGAGGRMGQALTRIVHETDGLAIAGGIEPEGSPFIGKDMGEISGLGSLGLSVTSDPIALFTQIDGIIDFTTPEATIAFAELTAQARIIHIIGTTGLNDTQEDKIKAASRHARIVKSGNMSLGVNLLAALARQVAAKLDENFDIEVLEMHHKHKVDAPSGTALLLGGAAAEGRDVPLEERAVRTRDGHTGERVSGDIGFATLRGGSVVGDHSVIFAGPSERITLSHHAESRDIFARGAAKAALWAKDKEPGLYSMFDVLDIS